MTTEKKCGAKMPKQNKIRCKLDKGHEDNGQMMHESKPWSWEVKVKEDAARKD